MNSSQSGGDHLAKHAEQAETPSNRDETVVDFPDNRLLIDLCGEFDRNLAQIEQLLGVIILRRGNQLAIHADAELGQRAREALEELYARLEQGRGVEQGDVAAAVRLGGSSARNENQMEMFEGGRIEVRTRRKTVEPRTKSQDQYLRQLLANELVFGFGPAGTGKTYIAVAAAVSMLIDGKVDRIILSRPAVEAGERLGFLPGDMKDKIDPYMQPLYDALNDFLPGKQLARMVDEKVIEIAPLAFMRGRTLANAFVVLDEAQNSTEMQMKMFLTRLGEGSRMAVTGDLSQIDLPRGVRSGLSQAKHVLTGVSGVAMTTFAAEDVVRHPLVARIVKAYEGEARRDRDDD